MRLAVRCGCGSSPAESPRSCRALVAGAGLSCCSSVTSPARSPRTLTSTSSSCLPASTSTRRASCAHAGRRRIRGLPIRSRACTGRSAMIAAICCARARCGTRHGAASRSSPRRARSTGTTRAGPGGARVLVAERAVSLSVGDRRGRQVRVAVAADLARVSAATAAFAKDLAIALACLALVLAVATSLQVGLGLRPLALLRRGVADIRAGRSRHLPSAVPVEVRPLVEEVNALSMHRSARSSAHAAGRRIWPMA